MDYLVISDSHIDPAVPLTPLWTKLGEYCVKNKPRYIIHAGDVACLDSLSHYISQRGSFTTDEELACVERHLRAFEDVIKRDQERCRASKHRMYRPIKVLCLGNHDIRKDNSGIKNLFERYGWVVADYLEPVTIEGITFCHCLPRRNSDVMCTTAEELLQTWHSTVVVGHSHTQDYAESYVIGSQQPIRAIKCPCFTMIPPKYGDFGNVIWPLGWLEITSNPFEFRWRNVECLWK